MPRFTRAKDLEAHLKKALDSLQAEVLVTTQGRLGSTEVSPYDTGRFRSSWFASEGPGSGAVAPEGTDSPNTDATDLRIDANKTYTIQNALPYAKLVAIEGNVVSQAKTWFTSFRNQTIPRIQAEAAKEIKERFDL